MISVGRVRLEKSRCKSLVCYSKKKKMFLVMLSGTFTRFKYTYVVFKNDGKRGDGMPGSLFPDCKSCEIVQKKKKRNNKVLLVRSCVFLYILYNPCINSTLLVAKPVIVVKLRYGSLYLYHFNNKQLL